VAERAFTSRSTLQRVEGGDTSVSIGIYAAVMQALGFLEGLGQLADISNDKVGQALATAALPRHIHLKRFPGTPDDGVLVCKDRQIALLAAYS
jgi:hypothetical protein